MGKYCIDFPRNDRILFVRVLCIGVLDIRYPSTGAMLVMLVPYPSEFLPVKWRAIIPCIPMWPLGVSLFALAGWVLEDWRQLHWACAALIAPNLLGVL